MAGLVTFNMKRFITLDQVFLSQIKARLVYTLAGLICIEQNFNGNSLH